MPSASAARAAARSHAALRALLMGGSALCGVAVLAAAGMARAGNALPTQGAVSLLKGGAGTISAKTLSGGSLTPGAIAYTSTGSSATLTLPQQRTLIDWTTFGVGSGDSLTYNFTSSSDAVVINRVPVGASIVIQDGGTVAGTFHGATGGNIWFLADGGVFIHGKVTANGVLATNNRVGVGDFDLLNDNLGALKTSLAAASGLIDVSGGVVASGVEVDANTGDIVLTGDIDAGATGGVQVATAGSVTQAAGRISAGAIDIAAAGSVILSAALDASSLSGVGGAITVTGRNLTLQGASVDASGATGGGAIRLGGDARGGGTLAQASAASIDAATTISADATVRGNGGSVVVWSTTDTGFAGQISAKGAGPGGDGGSAEVSSHGVLGYAGFANLTAPGGKTGTLLLDPTNLTISTGTTTNVTLGAGNPATDSPTAAAPPNSVLNNTDLNNQLAAASVIVTTVGSPGSTGQTGAINVTAPVSWSTANSLTLNAAGPISITSTISGANPSSSLALNAVGTITESGAGAISVGTLTGSSVGGATLTSTSNAIGTLGRFSDTASGNVSLTDSTALTVTGAVNVGTGTLTLAASGAISGAGATITAGVLTGSSVGGTNLNNASNAIGAFQNFTNTTGGDVILADGVDLSVQTLTNSVGTLKLTTTGALNQSGGGAASLTEGVDLILSAGTTLTLGNKPTVSRDYTITAATLAGQSLNPSFVPATGRDFTLNGAGSLTLTTSLTAPRNLVVTSTGALDTTGATLTAAGGTLILQGAAGLNVGPTVASSGASSFSTTAGNISLQGAVNATGQTLTLTATAGTIGQGAGGIITASTLTGLSSGGAALTDANVIGTFGPFSDTGNGKVSLTDSTALTVTGAVTIGTGTLTLAASGALSGSGATITAATLTGSSVGGATLTGANAFDALAGFANTGVGSVSITDAKASGLTVSALVNAGAGNTLTLTTTNGGSLALTAGLSAAGGSVDLVAAGAISQTSGVITTASLTGSSAGGASLAGANLFDTLAGFANTGVGDVSISDAKITGLTVNATVSAGTGNSLTLANTAGDLTQTAGSLTTGQDLTLAATGALTLSASPAVVRDYTVTAASFGAFSLSPTFSPGRNFTIDSLAGMTFSSSVTAPGALSITSPGALDVSTVTLTAMSGGLSLKAGNGLNVGVTSATGGPTSFTTTGGGITLLGAVNAGGNTVTITSAGAINQTGGVITAASLTGSSVGGASLTDANLFDTLAGFTNTAVGNLSIADAKASGLTVSAAVDAGSGNILTLTTTNAGSLTLSADLTAASGGVDLVSAGAISQTAGVITTGTLTGSSVGGAILGDANAFSTLGGLTNSGTGPVAIADAEGAGLTVNASVSAGTGNSLTLANTAGALTQTAGSLTSGQDLTLSAGTTLTLAAAPVVVRDYSATAATFAGFSLSPTFSPGRDFTINGRASLTLSATLTAPRNLSVTSTGNLDTTGASLAATGGSLTLVGGAGLNVGTTSSSGASRLSTTGGNISLQGAVTAVGQTVTLNSAGSIAQAAGAAITASAITGGSSTGASLTASNLFDALAGFTNTGAGNVSITDSKASGLTVTSAADAGARNTLTLTTTNGGPLALAANVSAAGGTVDLISAGALSQTAGVITASALTGSSAVGTSLTDANLFDTLAGFTNTGAGNVSITDSKANGLTVTSAGVDAGAGNTLTLTTTNGGPLALAANVSAAGGTVDLISAGALSQTAGVITASALMGSSVGGASLTDANLFDALAGFTSTGVGNVSITNSKASGLTVTSAVDAGAGNVLTLTTTSGGSLTLAANLTAATGTVDLVSSGPISQTAGVITASALMGSSAGGASLTDANLFDALAGFTSTGAGNVSITDSKASGLTVTSAVDAGAGNVLTLTTTRGGALTLAANVTAAGGTVDIVTAGPISQTSGTITTGTLTGSSAGGASLTDANLFDALAGFTSTGVGKVSITDAQLTGLTVTSAVDAGAGNVLTLTTSGGPLTLSANLTAATGTVDLVSSGPISQTAGVITASALTGSSAGGASLTDANLFDALAGFTSTGVGNVSITDAQLTGLTVTSAVDAGAGNVLTLTTTRGGALTLAAGLTAGGGTVDLVSAGPISQTAGVITTASLTGSSAGGARLTDANLFDVLAGFTNVGTGDFAVTDAAGSGLAVAADVVVGAGRAIALTTSGGPLTLGANLTAVGGAISLASAAAIDQTAGIIDTGTISGSSVGGASLADANLIGTLARFSNRNAGAITLVNAASLAVTGTVDNTPGPPGGTGRDIAVTLTSGSLTGTGVFTAARDVALQTVSGAQSFTSATAGGDLVLRSATGVTVTGTLAATGTASPSDIADPTGVGKVLAAGAPITLFGQTYATLTDGAHLDVRSSVGDIALGGVATAAGDVRVQALSGAIHTNDVTAGRTLILDAATTVDRGAAASNNLSGGLDVAVQAGSGPVDVGAISAAAGDAVLRSVAGSLTLASASAGDDLVMRAGTDVTVAGPLTSGAGSDGSGLADAFLASQPSQAMTVFGHTYASLAGGSPIEVVVGGAITLGGGARAHGGDIRLQAGVGTISLASPPTGSISYGSLAADSDILIAAGPGVAGGAVAAGRDVAISGGAVGIGPASAGDDVVIRSGGDLTVNGALTAGLTAEQVGAGDYLATFSPLSVLHAPDATLTDGSTVDIGAGGASINGPVTAIGAGSDVRIVITGPVRAILALFGPVSAGGDVALDSVGGSVHVAGAITAGRDAAVWSEAGSATLASVSAGDDVVLRAVNGAVAVSGNLASGTGADASGAGDTLAAASPLTLFKAADAGLAGGVIDVVAATVSVGGSTTANGSASDIRIVATGPDSGSTQALGLVGAVNAGQDLALDATGGLVGSSAGSITVGGAIVAGRDVGAHAATGSITLLSATAGDDVVLVAPSRSVTLEGSVKAAGAAALGVGSTLFGTVNSGLNGLFTLGAQSIYIDAVSYANKAYGPRAPASLTASNGIGVSLSDPTGLSLADTSPSTGSWLMTSTLLAPTVSLFEAKGNIDVAAGTVNGPVTRLNLYTPNVVSVTGLLAPATDNTANLVIGDRVQAAWTPSQIDVINDGGATARAGAIGFTSVTPGGVYSTSPRTFDTATLYATTDILLGAQAFVAANAAITGIAQIKQIDPSRPAPTVEANMSKAVMVAAGDLTLEAGSLIVQQNTTGLRTTSGTGYYVTRTLTLGAYTPFPPAIDLFGVFVKPGTTLPITGPAAADVNQIFLSGNLASSPYRALYRVNSCVIGELGNCTPTADGLINIPLDELSRGSLLSRDELDVEDPTITGAPNEEIWRRPDENQ